jgi:glucose-6-phosphate isomerase
LVTFLEVGNFQHHLELPGLFPDFEDLNYLGGHSLNELFRKEQAATAFGLMKEGRPSLTLRLPEINPFTLGQLIYLLEVAAVAAADLWGVDPARGRAAAGSRDFADGSWGRPGFETFRQEMEAAPPLLEKYTLS